MIWADPKTSGRYITDLRVDLMQQEYRQRCLKENGRADFPLTHEQRLRFELDMLTQYAARYALPEELIWRVYTLQIQLQAKGNTPTIGGTNARRGAEQQR